MPRNLTARICSLLRRPRDWWVLEICGESRRLEHISGLKLYLGRDGGVYLCEPDLADLFWPWEASRIRLAVAEMIVLRAEMEADARGSAT